MGIDYLGNKLASIITKELNYDENKKEIIAYAIETTLLFIIGALLILLFGFIFNALLPVILVAIFGSSLRRVSGGAHFNTPFKCMVFGSLIYGLIGVFAKKLINYDLTNKSVLMMSILLSLLIIVFLAPVDSEAKPIHSSSLKLKLKMSAIVFTTISAFIIYFAENPILSVSAVLGVSYQSITLLPIFNRKGGE